MSLQARTAVEFCADVASGDGGERADMAGSIDVGDGRVLSWCVFSLNPAARSRLGHVSFPTDAATPNVMLDPSIVGRTTDS